MPGEPRQSLLFSSLTEKSATDAPLKTSPMRMLATRGSSENPHETVTLADTYT